MNKITGWYEGIAQLVMERTVPPIETREELVVALMREAQWSRHACEVTADRIFGVKTVE